MNTLGTTALVTGAAKRVGKAIAMGLVDAGCDLVLHYHQSGGEAESFAEQVRRSGRKCRPIQADLSDPASLASMLQTLEDEGIHIDILVNSASVFQETPLPDITIAQWDENLNVNLRAPFLLAQSLGRRMVERGTGKIINIGDCAVNRKYRNYLPYLVSKVALTGMTEILALELAPEVQVNTVAPGTVLLPDGWPDARREQSVKRAPLKKLGTPEDIAAMVLHLVQHGDLMTGGYYAVDAGVGIR